MPGEPFDLKKIRRNWQLAGSFERSLPPGPLAEVSPPLDPFVAARHDLTRLRELVGAQFEPHIETLLPFLRRIDDAIARIEKVASGSAPGEDSKALREELQDALFDLEDLLEVFSLPPR